MNDTATRLSGGMEKGASPIVELALSEKLAGTTGGYFDRHRQVRSSALSYDKLARRQVWLETAAILKATGITPPD